MYSMKNAVLWEPSETDDNILKMNTSINVWGEVFSTLGEII